MLPKPQIATLYWLHLESHNDAFLDGYIGVTTRSIDVRFKEHCSRFNNSYNLYNPLHQAFSKYGIENILKTRLCVCDIKEAYELERVFRPFEYTGWNTVQGGKVSPIALEIIRRKRNALL